MNKKNRGQEKAVNLMPHSLQLRKIIKYAANDTEGLLPTPKNQFHNAKTFQGKTTRPISSKEMDDARDNVLCFYRVMTSMHQECKKKQSSN